MKIWIRHFLHGLSVDRLSRTGIILTTAAVVSFVLLEGATVLGMFHNAYAGLVTYMALPGMFILGLMLIPLSWFLQMRKRKQSLKALLKERFAGEALESGPFGALLIRSLLLMTVLNVVFMTFMGTQAIHYMDSAEFCGTTCHTIMGPEWAAYQYSPHARVDCVNCHIGDGLEALVRAKVNGAWQVISMTFGVYERPIPTPVKNLRPARETCEKCHWPTLFHGNRIANYTHYDQDSISTASYTTLMLKIGSGEVGQESGSHWHVAKSNHVTFASVNDDVEEILWVESRQPDGSVRRFVNQRMGAEENASATIVRTMDCIDCHNRATHVFEDPSDAVDLRMRSGQIDRTLPFAKRTALGALMGSYGDRESGHRGIDQHIRATYERMDSTLLVSRAAAIDSMILATTAIYDRNIHPAMNVQWGSYPNHLGHRDGGGCFRCHNRDLVDEEGRQISYDCTLCHSILANDEDQPFKYLSTPEEYMPRATREMRRYLRDDFWESVEK
ncbi:MAG: NapC/NirT family cytochrome c [Calditrichaeota bacterium]|nr:NapC/NirT family cytochrome c [Candidatus Cloacimonadota bacterium]MCA9785613.1 NapC/NirT family cytochrome c [Candidatus Cloacimonadota bacterium]MCB1046999.1 NapC/NirT family cytochrome c [Calditrichota bacterium]MCB9473483.1 NapC/NirT family cytochrome c [Candidatus Delongbacteria bacterium]